MIKSYKEYITELFSFEGINDRLPMNVISWTKNETRIEIELGNKRNPYFILRPTQIGDVYVVGLSVTGVMTGAEMRSNPIGLYTSVAMELLKYIRDFKPRGIVAVNPQAKDFFQKIIKLKLLDPNLNRQYYSYISTNNTWMGIFSEETYFQIKDD